MHLQIRRIEVFCTLENFTCTMIPMACLFVQFEMRFEFVRKKLIKWKEIQIPLLLAIIDTRFYG